MSALILFSFLYLFTVLAYIKRDSLIVGVKAKSSVSELLSVAEAAKATNDPEEKFALLKRYDELSAKLAEELASDQTKAKVDETVFHQPFDEIDEVEEPPNNVTSISSFASKKRA